MERISQAYFLYKVEVITTCYWSDKQTLLEVIRGLKRSHVAVVVDTEFKYKREYIRNSKLYTKTSTHQE